MPWCCGCCHPDCSALCRHASGAALSTRPSTKQPASDTQFCWMSRAWLLSLNTVVVVVGAPPRVGAYHKAPVRDGVDERLHAIVSATIVVGVVATGRVPRRKDAACRVTTQGVSTMGRDLATSCRQHAPHAPLLNAKTLRPRLYPGFFATPGVCGEGGWRRRSGRNGNRG